MTEFVYNRLIEQLWLEDTPEYYKDEYYCPQLESIDSYLEEYGTFEDLRIRELIFAEWEVKQQEMFVDGLGNVDERNPKSLFSTLKMVASMIEIAKKRNVVIMTAQQGVKNSQPTVIDSIDSIGGRV